MKRRTFFCSVLPAALASQANVLLGHDHEKHGKDKGREHHDDDRPYRSPNYVQYFRPEDQVFLTRYYPVSTLPPGLRKKYVRTGTLPSGWQKRIQPLPVALVQQLPPPPPNCERGYVDGYAVVYDRKTRVVLDTVDLIGALTGR